MSLQIKQWIQKFAQQSVCKFEQVEPQKNQAFQFYQAQSDTYQRFLVVADVEQLPKSSDINAQVLEETPEQLISLPSFSKNTDLILLYKRDNLALSSQEEAKLYAIEEDSYSFKKHVLYYTEKELEQFQANDNIEDDSWLLNRDEFVAYRKKPLDETAYSLLIRLYIKLPFLKVPVAQEQLLDISELANKKLEAKNLTEVSKKFDLYFDNSSQILANDEAELEQLIKEFINE